MLKTHTITYFKTYANENMHNSYFLILLKKLKYCIIHYEQRVIRNKSLHITLIFKDVSSACFTEILP